MKITENKKGRCTGCCAAALFAGLDGTYDFLLVAPVFLHPAAKDAKNHLTNCYRGGVLYRKSRLHKKVIGACKKIVRLILMSNISRRKFLKGAGVAALAVAAAGVLAGCSGNGDKVPGTNVPDQPGVTSANIHVMFTDADGNGIRGAKVYDTSVLKGVDKYDPSLIPAEALPDGYKLVNKDLVDIIWKTELEGYVTVAVTEKVTTNTGKHIKVTLDISKNAVDTERQHVLEFNADVGDTISTDDIPLPKNYEWAEGVNGMSYPLKAYDGGYEPIMHFIVNKIK